MNPLAADHNSEPLSSIIEAILPAVGYIGNLKETCLKIDIGREWIKLKFPSIVPERVLEYRFNQFL